MSHTPNDPPRQADEEKVGYGKPPVAHQFKPGNQAARKERKTKGRKNDKTIVREIAQTPVEVTQPSGKRKKMTLWEAAVRTHAVNGAKGNVRSWEAFNKLYEKYEAGESTAVDEPVGADEQLGVDVYFAAWAKSDPERAVAMLREVGILPQPVKIITAVQVPGRPTVRRVDFRLAEELSQSQAGGGFVEARHHV